MYLLLQYKADLVLQGTNAEEAQAADFRRLPALTNLPQSYGSLIDN
jgi:hypothetical protein